MKRKIISVLLTLTMILVSTITVAAETTSSPKSSIELNTTITEQPFITENIEGTLKVMENAAFTRVIVYDDTQSVVADITYFGDNGLLLNNLTEEIIDLSDATLAVSAPPGVSFGDDHPYKGTYEMTGVAISVEAVLICLALGIPAGTAAVVSMVTIAVSLGLSHIYWTKKVAYGEDSQYLYVRTKTQFYKNSSRTAKIGSEIVTYQKKAKGGSVRIAPVA